MSENEFELYLSLLGKFLRLKPGQRSEIADELRDHLEARLEELSNAGLTREQAIHAALEEFGDAADLAQHFSQIAQRRRRRFIMRCTLGTVACLTAAILITTAFWPGNQGAPVPQNAVAQAKPETKTNAKSTTPADRGLNANVSVLPNVVTPYRDERYAYVLGQLKEKTTLNFPDATLREVIDYIAELHKIPIIYNHKSLTDEGIDLDAIKITYSLVGIPLATCLDLIFENQLVRYRVWEGLIIIESINSAETYMEVCIYNCRDLLDGVLIEKVVQSGAVRGGGGGGGGGGFFQVDDSITAQHGDGNANNSKDNDKKADEPQPPAADELTPSQMLIKVLTNSVNGPWEDPDGQGGTITAFNGMLVVKNNQKAQQGVQTVLEMLRAADLQHPRPKAKSTQMKNAHDETPFKLQSSQGQTYDPNTLPEAASDPLKTTQPEERQPASQKKVPDLPK